MQAENKTIENEEGGIDTPSTRTPSRISIIIKSTTGGVF